MEPVVDVVAEDSSPLSGEESSSTRRRSRGGRRRRARGGRNRGSAQRCHSELFGVIARNPDVEVLKTNDGPSLLAHTISRIQCPKKCSSLLTEWLCETCGGHVFFSLDDWCFCYCGRYSVRAVEYRCNLPGHELASPMPSILEFLTPQKNTSPERAVECLSKPLLPLLKMEPVVDVVAEDSSPLSGEDCGSSRRRSRGGRRRRARGGRNRGSAQRCHSELLGVIARNPDVEVLKTDDGPSLPTRTISRIQCPKKCSSLMTKWLCETCGGHVFFSLDDWCFCYCGRYSVHAVEYRCNLPGHELASPMPSILEFLSVVTPQKNTSPERAKPLLPLLKMEPVVDVVAEDASPPLLGEDNSSPPRRSRGGRRRRARGGRNRGRGGRSRLQQPSPTR